MSSTFEILQKTFSDVAADATSVSFDAPGGLYDRLANNIESSGMRPEKRLGLLAVLGGAFTLHSFLKQKMGTSPLENYFVGVTGSALRQVGRRALNAQRTGQGIDLPDSLTQPTTAKGSNALFEVSADVRGKILRLFEQLDDEQKQLFKGITKNCDTTQLGSIAEMSSEDLTALLSFLTKKPFSETIQEVAKPTIVSITAGIKELRGRIKGAPRKE